MSDATGNSPQRVLAVGISGHSARLIAQPYRRHRHQEFFRFLKVIDAAVPKDLDLVLDNSAIHQWLLKHPRFHLRFTPDQLQAGSTSPSAGSPNSPTASSAGQPR